MRFVLTILMTLLLLKNYGQGINLRIIDEVSLMPIEGVHVVEKGVVIGVSTADGVVNIKREVVYAKLTHVAFEPKVINLSFTTQDTILVQMRGINISLPEFSVTEIKRRKRYVKMGITSKKPSQWYPGYPIDGIFAQYITNEKPEFNYKIEGLYIYIKENYVPETQFLVSIYAGETVDKQPNDALKLMGPLLCQTQVVGSHFKIDLEKHNIVMPKNGVFVIFEGSPHQNLWSADVRKGMNANRAHFVRVGYAHEKQNHYLTWHFNNGKWERFIKPSKNARGLANYIDNPMIYVKLEIIQ